MTEAQELKIDTNVTAMDMAEAMFGDGIKIVSASFTGVDTAKGIYSGADATMPGVAPSDSGVILSTGKVTDITNSSGDANVSAGTTTNHGLAGDSDLDEIAGGQTFDAAVFKADFIPQGSVLTMQVTFSSEEYLEYVNSGFNDAVGVWVNGQKAVLTVGSGDITINNINTESNSNLYLDNPASAEVLNTEMDGVTVTLTLKAPVIPGEVNTIKIAIADGGDGAYDSNLMIAGDSLQTVLIAGDDVAEFTGTDPLTLDVLANDVTAAGGSLTITHINGQEVVAGDEIKLGSGEVVRLNGDGTLTLMSDGTVEANAFSYTVADTAGNTDTAFVKMTSTTVPCFTAGTPVDTPRGPIPVEELRPGDAVLTRDGGIAILRWVGIAARRAEGRTAPVRISAGLFGATRDIAVSPQHRILVTGHRAALLFGEEEVLVRARDLVDGCRVTWEEDGAPLRYVHLMFDRHEMVSTYGLWSESYQPGARTLSAFDTEAREELLRLYPELASLGPGGWGQAARMTLREREARVLIAAPPPATQANLPPPPG
jgi:hypothetical protein